MSKKVLFCLPLSAACLFSCVNTPVQPVDNSALKPEPAPARMAADTSAQILPSSLPQTVEPVVTEPVKIEPVKIAPVIKDAVVTDPAKPEIQKTVPDKIPVTEKTVAEKSAIETSLKDTSLNETPPEKAIQPVESVEPETPVQAVVEPVPAMPVLGSVKGTVTILGKNSEQLPAGEVIVNLEPLFPVPAANKQQKTYEISMVDKKYTPGVVTIRPGDTVKFHNKDSIKHNVFSSSGDNAFELGTYGLDVTEGATLKHPGIVKVYCNIHADMAAFISVSESGYSFVTKDNGQFYFNELPVGEYQMKIWHVRGEVTRKLQVIASQPANGDVVINSASYVPGTHLNKFGKPYTTTPTLFNDEFY
jgi:plastocyanin